MVEKKVLNTIKKYNLIEPEDKIIVAVSGGSDSMCLLLILNKLSKELRFKMVVCHVNHGLRENANIDEKFVKDFCEENNIEYYIKKADIKRNCKRRQNRVRRSSAEKYVMNFFMKQ